MRVLIAVMTAHRYNYQVNSLTVDYVESRGWRCTSQDERVTAIRETWAKNIPNVKFFYGRASNGETPLDDEVFLDCGDKYIDNPAKMQAICRYALEHGFDFVLRVDDDTFIYPDRLLKTDFRGHDYSGSRREGFHPGGCLFLSHYAMTHLVPAHITHWADDLWIGNVMSDYGIPMHFLKEIHNEFGDGYRVDPEKVDTANCAAFHSCTPEVMRALWMLRTT